VSAQSPAARFTNRSFGLQLTNVAVPSGYSFKQLIVAVLLSTLFVAGFAGAGLFLYYSAHLRTAESELKGAAMENQKDKTLLHPLIVTFGEDRISHWPTDIQPQSGQALNKVLASPVLVIDGSGAAYSAKASTETTQVRVSVKEERIPAKQKNSH